MSLTLKELIFYFFLFLSQGCIYQHLPECEGHSFRLHYITDVENPANMLEDDMHIHIYAAGILDTVLVIPADEIVEEKLYPLPDHYEGEITLMAWAIVKGGSEIYGIPEGIPGKV